MKKGLKNLLILSPYWVTANLVGTQRYRLVANYLEDFGWHPIVLAVSPKYYSMTEVLEMNQLVSSSVEVHFVKAFLGKGCFLGKDVSWRAIFQLYSEALKLIEEKKIQFIWVMIPSGISPILARFLHDRTGIRYGIDYTDPWVTSNNAPLFSKTWFVHEITPFLEKYSVKRTSFLAGVSELSYLPVIERNPHLKNIPRDVFSLGFDEKDFSIQPTDTSIPWTKDKMVLMYAGAIPPSYFYFWRVFFRVLIELRKEEKVSVNLRIIFFGTQNNMLKLAKEEGIEELVEEFDRISYLRVLYLLKHANGLLAIGNPEPHYTPSKIFQLLYSKRPIFAVSHLLSTVNRILEQCGGDTYLVKFDPLEEEKKFRCKIKAKLIDFLQPNQKWSPNLSALKSYSAKTIASKLVNLLK